MLKRIGLAILIVLIVIMMATFTANNTGMIDIDLAFAQLGALYLAANTVASAVPTPGGVGAVEAALVFVLTNAGVDDAAAWAAGTAGEYKKPCATWQPQPSSTARAASVSTPSTTTALSNSRASSTAALARRTARVEFFVIRPASSRAAERCRLRSRRASASRAR